MKWEYRIIQFLHGLPFMPNTWAIWDSHRPEPLEIDVKGNPPRAQVLCLNQLGNEGWEVVASTVTTNETPQTIFSYTLKRCVVN